MRGLDNFKTKQLQKKLEPTEIWFLIQTTAKKSNETVFDYYKKLTQQDHLMNEIHTGQATSFLLGPMRREKLEHLVTTGMIEGKRTCGKTEKKRCWRD